MLINLFMFYCTAYNGRHFINSSSYVASRRKDIAWLLKVKLDQLSSIKSIAMLTFSIVQA